MDEFGGRRSLEGLAPVRGALKVTFRGPITGGSAIEGAGVSAILEPDEPPPFECVNGDGAGLAVLTCDHASNRFPRRLGTLGLTEVEARSHVAWDPGASWVARHLSREIDAPLVLSGYSRLVFDCNRPPGSPTAIPAVSGGIRVPGNEGLREAEAKAREDALLHPYQAAIARLLDARARAGRPTVLLCVHSFTPDYPGEDRPWTIGLGYNRDRRLAALLLDALRVEPGIVVGDNRPYGVDDESDYTIPVQGERRGIPHVLIEIRQDCIATPEAARGWAERLARVFRRIEADALALASSPPTSMKSSTAP